jgi:hypothetical protein
VRQTKNQIRDDTNKYRFPKMKLNKNIIYRNRTKSLVFITTRVGPGMPQITFRK